MTLLIIIACHLTITSLSAAQGGRDLPAPGVMVQASAAYQPVVLKGLLVKPDRPLEFDFIVDPGDSVLPPEAFNAEADKLLKYFLAALTVPEEDLWVNLSPYEKDRIIPEQFGKTGMGLDLLSQDYLLKQLTATFLNPDSAVGRRFWDKIHASVAEESGGQDAVINTFNKVWIMPDIAQVFENKDRAFILDSKLKVLLEEDYIALQKSAQSQSTSLALQPSLAEQNDLKNNAALLREIVLPEIENEINHGQTFAPLRQIYHAIILATWFKENLKKSVLHKVYIDENKIAGVNSTDAPTTDEIYNHYLAAFKTGVCHFIREEYDPKRNAVIPRKYFSGGARLSVDLSTRPGLEGAVLNNNLIILSSAIAPARVASDIPAADLSGEIAALQTLLSDPAYLVKNAEPRAAAEILDSLPHFYGADEARVMMDFLVGQFPEQLNPRHQDTFSQKIFLRSLENIMDDQVVDERHLLGMFQALGESVYDYQDSVLMNRFVAFRFSPQRLGAQRFSSAGWLTLLRRVLSIDKEGGQYAQLSFLIMGAVKNFDKELFLRFLSLLDDFFYRQEPADSSQEVSFDTFKKAIFDILMQERARWRRDTAVLEQISRLIDDNVAIDRSTTFAGGKSAHSLTGLQAATLLADYPLEFKASQDPYFDNYKDPLETLKVFGAQELRSVLPDLETDYVVLGRTIFSKDQDGQWVGLKIMKTDERPEELLLMSKNLGFIDPHRPRLRSPYPEQYALLGENIFLADAAAFPMRIRRELDAAARVGRYALDTSDQKYTVVSYALPKASPSFQPEYFFQYAHDPGIPTEEFDQMSLDALHDLIYFIQLGLPYESIADLFHNERTHRRYFWNADLLTAIEFLKEAHAALMAGGAGRLDRQFSKENGPVTYTDQRRGTLADQGDMRQPEDIVLKDRTVAPFGIKNNNLKKLTLLGDQLLVLILNKMQHLANQGLLKDDAVWHEFVNGQPNAVFLNLEQFLRSLIAKAAEYYLADDALSAIFNQRLAGRFPYKRITRQLLYYYSGAYKDDFNSGRVAAGIYGATVKVEVPDLRQDARWGTFSEDLLLEELDIKRHDPRSHVLFDHLSSHEYTYLTRYIGGTGFDVAYRFEPTVTVEKIRQDKGLQSILGAGLERFIDFYRDYRGGWRDNMVDEDGGPFNGPWLLFDIPELLHETVPVLMVLKEHPDKQDSILTRALRIGQEERSAGKAVGGIDLNPRAMGISTRGADVDFVMPPNITDLYAAPGLTPKILAATPVADVRQLLNITP